MDTIAKSYEYVNGKCYVDGVVQNSNDACNAIGGFVFGAFAVLFLIFAIVGLIFFIWWIFMLIHVIKNEDIKDRTVWLIVLLASLPLGFIWLSAPVYHFAVKRPYDKSKFVETRPSNSAAASENMK